MCAGVGGQRELVEEEGILGGLGCSWEQRGSHERDGEAGNPGWRPPTQSGLPCVGRQGRRVFQTCSARQIQGETQWSWVSRVGCQEDSAELGGRVIRWEAGLRRRVKSPSLSLIHIHAHTHTSGR